MTDRKIIDYDLVCGINNNDLNEHVKLRLSEGWELYGNPLVFDYTNLAQPMVRYEQVLSNAIPTYSTEYDENDKIDCKHCGKFVPRIHWCFKQCKYCGRSKDTSFPYMCPGKIAGYCEFLI